MLPPDASPPEWWEGRAPERDLLGAIDDATGHVVYAHFRPSEDQLGYLLMLRTIALTYGLQHILYHDRHTILSPKQATIEDEPGDANRGARSNESSNNLVLLRFRRSRRKPKGASNLSGKLFRIDFAKRCGSPALLR